MAFTIRRLFWFTTFIAIYAALYSKHGAAIVFVIAFLGFGLMTVVSSLTGGYAFADDERIGWDVLYASFATPAVIFIVIVPSQF